MHTCQVELFLLPCRLWRGMEWWGGCGAAGQRRSRGRRGGGGGGWRITAGVWLVRDWDVILGRHRNVYLNFGAYNFADFSQIVQVWHREVKLAWQEEWPIFTLMATSLLCLMVSHCRDCIANKDALFYMDNVTVSCKTCIFNLLINKFINMNK